MVGMHLGILALVSFADLSAGMLMLHLFTIDSRWLRSARIVGDLLTSDAEAPRAAASGTRT